MRLATTVTAMVFLGLLADPAAARVLELTLDNGLKLVVKEDRRAPVVVSQVWYRVGSSYEHGGITGLSHMLEHMMFKGTQSYAPGEFSRLIAAQGGQENAFTGQDYTAYFQRLARDRLEISFRLEADRMRSLVITEEEFRKERDVVAEERRLRTEDQPNSLVYEQFLASAFQTSAYRDPVIGWMADIQSYQLADLLQWYERWYAPNNAVLVVAGDVEAEQVVDLARRHFGPLKPGPISAPKPRPEVAQRGERRIVVRVPAKLPYLLMGYKVPVLKTSAEEWEPYALDVLAAILAGDDSARLPRELVRGQELAADASVFYDPQSRLDTLMVIEATPAKDRGVADLEQALRRQVARVQQEPVTPQELERVKTQVVTADVYERDSVFYQAMRIGKLEAIGLPWQVADQYVERVRAVTPEQVQAVARKYLLDERLTVAVLEPQPLAVGQARTVSGDHRHVR